MLACRAHKPHPRPDAPPGRHCRSSYPTPPRGWCAPRPPVRRHGADRHGRPHAPAPPRRIALHRSGGRNPDAAHPAQAPQLQPRHQPQAAAAPPGPHAGSAAAGPRPRGRKPRSPMTTNALHPAALSRTDPGSLRPAQHAGRGLRSGRAAAVAGGLAAHIATMQGLGEPDAEALFGTLWQRLAAPLGHPAPDEAPPGPPDEAPHADRGSRRRMHHRRRRTTPSAPRASRTAQRRTLPAGRTQHRAGPTRSAATRTPQPIAPPRPPPAPHRAPPRRTRPAAQAAAATPALRRRHRPALTARAPIVHAA